MLQKAKSTLLKVLICVCLVCCLVAMFVAMTACNKTEAPTVVGGKVDSNGHLILEMSDGTTQDAGLVAQPGTPGTNGTNGANGVGIKMVTIDADGNLCIELTDGSKLTVEIPAYSENCKGSADGHRWVELHKVVDANCICGETWLTVCRNPGCNAMYLKETTEKDATNHLSLEPYGKQPSCTEGGSTDQICPDCGVVIKGEVLPALGHTGYVDADGKAWRGDETALPEGVHKAWTPVVDDISIFCLEGGQEVVICTDCHEVVIETRESDAPNHLLTGEWVIKERPTDDATGLAEGACARCGQTTIVLPKLTAKDESGELLWKRSAPSDGVCTEGNVKAVETTYTYTYTYKDGADLSETKTHEFTFTVEEDVKHVFTLDGVENYFQTGEISGNSPVYDDNEAFGHFANSPSDCTKIGYASFTCEKCGGTILILVRGSDHDPDLTQLLDEKEPTCTERGYKEYQCKHGADDPETSHTVKVYEEALGHDWEVDEEASDFTKAPTSATIVLKCKRCTETETIEAENLTQERTEPTCAAAGKVTYTYDYTPEGGEKVTGAKTEIVLEQLYHTVTKNGKSFTFNKSHDVAVDLSDPYELEEIATALGYESISALLEDRDVAVSQFANSHPSCTEPGFVSFKCSAGCEGNILVAVRGEHSWKADPSKDKVASCEGEGQAPAKAYVCENDASHVKYETTGEIPAHEWQAELDADKTTVHFSCKNCTAKQDGVLDKTQGTDGITRVEPTCKPGDEGKGSVTYFYKDPAGKSGSITVELPRIETHTFHELTGIYDSPSQLQNYTLGQFKAAGSLEDDDFTFANSNPTCQSQGFITITCTACGDKLVIYVKGDHNLGPKQSVAPTCVKDGYSYQECSECHERVTTPGDPNKGGHKISVVVTQAPTADQGGVATVTCSQCAQVSERIELPALSSKDWKVDSVGSSCLVKGSDTYTYTTSITDKETEEPISVTVKVVVEREIGEHKLDAKEYDWFSSDQLTHYWGHMCSVCKQMVVSRTEKLEQLVEPEEGEYYLSLFQASRNDGEGERLYLTGNMKNTYYLEASADFADAAVVTLEKSGEDGWVIKVGGKFLEIVNNNSHINAVFSETQTEGLVWKWNADLGLFTVTINDTEYYIGTYSTYDTMSPSAISFITGDNAKNVGVSQFPAYLFELVVPEAAE